MDSNDRNRITHAQKELEALLTDAELKDAVLLVIRQQAGSARGHVHRTDHRKAGFDKPSWQEVECARLKVIFKTGSFGEEGRGRTESKESSPIHHFSFFYFSPINSATSGEGLYEGFDWLASNIPPTRST